MITLVITIGFAVIYQLCTFWQCSGLKLRVREISMGGLTCALTLVLASIIIPLPTGATITCGSMLPLMLLAIVYDARLAMLCGWICGVLAMVLLPIWQPVHWAQIFVEHLVCFSCLGYAGIFGSNNRVKILCGMTLAITIKFFGHVLSGVIFFSQNAWDGWGALGYSMAYHLSSKLPEGIATAVILLALPISGIKKTLTGSVK